MWIVLSRVHSLRKPGMRSAVLRLLHVFQELDLTVNETSHELIRLKKNDLLAERLVVIAGRFEFSTPRRESSLTRKLTAERK